MATDYDVKPGACRTNVDLFDVVQHVYRYAADFNHFPIWNRRRPISLVIVSPHRDDGRDLIQRVKHLLVYDIPAWSTPASASRARGITSS